MTATLFCLIVTPMVVILGYTVARLRAWGRTSGVTFRQAWNVPFPWPFYAAGTLFFAALAASCYRQDRLVMAVYFCLLTALELVSFALALRQGVHRSPPMPEA